jgi:ribosome modulation factor
MSMNFKFSRGYGECQAVQSIEMCCYSNINSAEVLLEQQ